MSPVFAFSLIALFLVLTLVERGWSRRFAEALRDAIDRFKGGGPPTPMHPSPAGDHELLRGRR